jgi:hypothetical protein
MLIPGGVAGAQRSFVCKLVAALAPMVKFGKVQLLLNSGDHAHMKQAFEEVLLQVDLEYSIVPDMAGVKKFRQDMVTLMIQRVGDHEQFSALHASELGDGTLEAREIEDCLEYVKLFMKRELLTSMNQAIMKNFQIGIYNGCKNAIRIALEHAKEMSK